MVNWPNPVLFSEISKVAVVGPFLQYLGNERVKINHIKYLILAPLGHIMGFN